MGIDTTALTPEFNNKLGCRENSLLDETVLTVALAVFSMTVH